MPLLNPARYKGAFGGRATGKSHFFSEMLIEAHILDPNTSSVCVREVQRSLDQSVKRLLEVKIEEMCANDYFEVRDTAIKSKRGNGLIIFQGMQNHTADSIKSLEGYDRAWVEEAQSLSQRSLDLLVPTIRRENSELWFTWNPYLPTDPVDSLLRNNPPPDSVVVRVNFEDNPWFPDVLRQEMEYMRKRDYAKYLHVWEGEYMNRTDSRVFSNWEVREFEAPDDAVFKFGADWGFSVDPSVLVRSYTVGREIYVDYEAYKVGCEIQDLPDLFMSIPEAEKWTIRADSSRPETISYMQKHGFPKMLPAKKGKGSIVEGVEWLKSHDIIVHPRCEHLIEELRMYSYKTDPQTDEVLPVLEDKHNHCVDCLRYSLENTMRVDKSQNNLREFRPLPVMHKWN